MQLLTLMLYSRLDISSERWWSAVRDDRSCHWKSRGQVHGAASGSLELARAVDHDTSSVSDGPVQGTLLQSLGETGSPQEISFALFQLLETPEEASNKVTTLSVVRTQRPWPCRSSIQTCEETISWQQ